MATKQSNTEQDSKIFSGDFSYISRGTTLGPDLRDSVFTYNAAFHKTDRDFFFYV